MFVFRDRTKTPLEKLKETWECDLQRMWESLAKPPDYENSSLEDFFDIQYAALSNYEDRQDEFLAETTLLRRRFTNDGVLALLFENMVVFLSAFVYYMEIPGS
jgi:hypothetical protein